MPDSMKALKLGRPSSRLKDAITYLEFMVVSTQNRPSFFAKRIEEVRKKCPSANRPKRSILVWPNTTPTAVLPDTKTSLR